MSLFVNTSSGHPCLQSHLKKIAEARVKALLSGIATNSAYFENASVTHKMYPFPNEDVFNRPNRSMCTLCLVHYTGAMMSKMLWLAFCLFLFSCTYHMLRCDFQFDCSCQATSKIPKLSLWFCLHFCDQS